MELLPQEALLPENIAARHTATKPKLKPKPKSKRSSTRCFSCKKLKIKCDGVRPSCEYCAQTNRICMYQKHSEWFEMLDETHIAALRAMMVSSKGYTNNCTKEFNSMQRQMNITRFEQKLLKFYLDFGGSFFTQNKSPETKKVFEVDAPMLWRQSPLMRNSLYACATIYLWKFYHFNHLSDIYLSGDQYLILHNNNDPKAQSLLAITDYYIQKTMHLLKVSIKKIRELKDLDSVGSFMLSNVILFTVISVHPMYPSVLVSYNGSNDLFIDIFDVSYGIVNVSKIHSDIISGSRFELLLYKDEEKITPPEGSEPLFPFIRNLRHYLDEVVTEADGNFATYHQAVTTLDYACYRAMQSGYVLPILRGIIHMSHQPTFIALIRARDYIAMKIMFSYCCLISICGIKMFQDMSIWDSYIEEFRVNALLMFGGFEDEFDAVLYDQVHRRIAHKSNRDGKPFLDPAQLTLIGTGELLTSSLP